MGQARSSFSGAKLSFYFDEVKKDCSDLQATTSSWDEWLRLRPKVLSLPQSTFKTTLAAVEAILDHAADQNRPTKSDKRMRSKDQQAASNLFEAVRKKPE